MAFKCLATPERVAAYRALWREAGIEYGLCLCGCGRRTKIAPQSNTQKGWLNGEPTRYVNGHTGTERSNPYVVDDATGCWVWQMSKGPKGYGFVGDEGVSRLAHRVYYAKLVGPIPDGHFLHHRCENPSCVNPEHLEPLTPGDHVRLHRRIGSWTK